LTAQTSHHNTKTARTNWKCFVEQNEQWHQLVSELFAPLSPILPLDPHATTINHSIYVFKPIKTGLQLNTSEARLKTIKLVDPSRPRIESVISQAWYLQQLQLAFVSEKQLRVGVVETSFS
jgi:hypothetical protein